MTDDGHAGDVDYREIGHGYAQYRRAEPRIAAIMQEYLDGASSIVNVGAGAGSYEPQNRDVTAIEPSASMRSQRPAHLPPAVDAVAEQLPFPDKHFDAAMATFTVHQWPKLDMGLSEMRRVTRGRIVILTCAPNELDRFWLNTYAPEVIAIEAKRYPSIATITAELGGDSDVVSVRIPFDCTDGFNEAYYGRPEKFLDDAARRACSAWSFVSPTVTDRFLDHLRRELTDGTWDAAYGHFREQPEFEGSLKLIVATPHAY